MYLFERYYYEPGRLNKTYPNISLDIPNQQLSGTTVHKSTLQAKWRKLLESNFITPISQKPEILKMWAFGWNSLSGLVDNKPFPYEANSTTFHLRYIPVDFNLFDSVMAELGLRRQPSSAEESNTATYKPSDWVSETDESAWWVDITRTNNAGFKVTVHDGTTATNITFNNNVEQFGQYDFSQPNANTLDNETEGRFFVSWPEKMLLQEFLGKELADLPHITYAPTVPEIWWAILPETYQNYALKQNLVGIGYYPKTITSTSFEPWHPEQFEEYLKNYFLGVYNDNSRKATSARQPALQFLGLIREGDFVVLTNGDTPIRIGSFTPKDIDHQTHHQPTGHQHLFRSVKWQNQTSSNLEQTLLSKLGTIETKFTTSMSTLRTPRPADNTGSDLFTAGWSKKGTRYYDFLTQRAKVLDPTSRALLVYLKYNTPIHQTTDTPEDENSEESSVPTPAPRTPDKLSTNTLIQKLTLSKNLILEGVPGTGKTYAFNHDLVENWFKILNREGNSRSITMHPSTSYEDFLEGLRPTSIQTATDADTVEHQLTIDKIKVKRKQDNDSINPQFGYFYHPVGSDTDEDTPTSNFTVADGFFLNVCKQAVQNPSKDFLVLLDEINRCNIPSVFGDLLTAIERSKRATWDNGNQCWDLDDAQIITLAISKRKFFVPENVYVVGTMNTTDRSVAPMDMALRRRFAFHRIEPVAPDITTSFNKGLSNLDNYQSILDISIKALKSLNGIEKMNAFRNKKKKDEKAPIVLAKWGKDALIGYSYIYDLARDLQQYHDLGMDTYTQLLEHHWNHHILPQLADIVFSNQINRGDKSDLEKLLQQAKQTIKHQKYR